MGAAGDIEVGGGGTSRKRVIQDSLRLTRCTRRVRQGYYAIDVRKRIQRIFPRAIFPRRWIIAKSQSLSE